MTHKAKNRNVMKTEEELDQITRNLMKDSLNSLQGIERNIMQLIFQGKTEDNLSMFPQSPRLLFYYRFCVYVYSLSSALSFSSTNMETD